MGRKHKQSGKEVFERYYLDLYQDRWESLRGALEQSGQPVARLNPFVEAKREELFRAGTEVFCEDPFPHWRGAKMLAPAAGGAGDLLPYYRMDLASFFPARALLPLSAGMTVLDMCAAPGGKSLILAEGLGATNHLVANDLSQERRRRLQRVLRSYLPTAVLARVRITGFDASRWGLHERGAFQRVLVDAPCSSERHVLHSASELALWSPARTRHLQVRQMALVAAAFDVLSPGGEMVYATCSVHPGENDGIVARLLKKRGSALEILPSKAPLGEATEYGWQIFPDRGAGWGPIYWSHMRRNM